MFHPLLPKDHAEAEAGQQHRPQVASPPHQRGDPGLPGNGGTFRQAFVESDGRLPISHNAPIGDVLEQEFVPAVLRCDKVGRGSDDAQKIAGQPLPLHEGGHHAHTGDSEEFGGQQAAAPVSQEHVEAQQTEEGNEECLR